MTRKLNFILGLLYTDEVLMHGENNLYRINKHRKRGASKLRQTVTGYLFPIACFWPTGGVSSFSCIGRVANFSQGFAGSTVIMSSPLGEKEH